jgi:hypothetical protein
MAMKDIFITVDENTILNMIQEQCRKFEISYKFDVKNRTITFDSNKFSQSEFNGYFAGMPVCAPTRHMRDYFIIPQAMNK